jgi:hypothetical protein
VGVGASDHGPGEHVRIRRLGIAVVVRAGASPRRLPLRNGRPPGGAPASGSASRTPPRSSSSQGCSPGCNRSAVPTVNSNFNSIQYNSINSIRFDPIRFDSILTRRSPEILQSCVAFS